MTSDTTGTGLARAYFAADQEVRLRLSKVGCTFAITLMPAGSSLDYFVYPALLGPMFRVRMISVLWAGAILALLYTPFGRRHVRFLGFAWVLVPAAAIAWMIYISEGAVSPYYAGLNIAMIAVCMLMPWTFWEAVGTCAILITMYLGACLLHRETPFDRSIFFNNVYFLVLTAIVCVTTCYFTARRRFEEFRLRHEVAVRNQELAESYERLSELDRLKSEFFANISHELRTPLTLILSPVEDLLRRGDPVTASARKLLGVVRDNSLRLLKLINDLLELVRLEEGRSHLDRRSLDLSTFVPGIAESVRHLADQKGLELEVSGTDLPVTVDADSGRLEKVLLNLLVNAIKFTPAPGKVTTRWRQEGGRAFVEVEDTGIGIADEDLPFVFDRFRQADGSSTRKYQGSGIGLALARELVEEHGGSLEAHSKVGEGTLLRMDLPLADDSTASPATPPADVPGEDFLSAVHRAADHFIARDSGNGVEELTTLGTGPFTVLVVEDEPDLRQFLAAALATEYRVLQAADGETGLAMIREHRPHLVLLDLMLPGMDGLGLCETVKSAEETKGIKVVLLTARTDEAAKLEALKRGADDFLLKPFSTVEVRTRLANLLRAAQLEEDLRDRNTKLEEALARLQEAEAQLVQTEKMNALGNLAAGVLHEINNPLNYTLTALQLAEESVRTEDEDLRETLDDIGEGMRRIRDIVSDLRSFAYPSSGSVQERFEWNECMDKTLRLVSHEIDGVRVHRETPSGCVVVGSKTQIAHLLMNLLTNSAQALRRKSDAQSPEIRITTAAENGRLAVRVWDNGSGIAEQDLPKIFEPFFTTKDVGEGMGLGLSICHTIVKNHGGTISACSDEGKWTEVTFDLPLASEELTDDKRV